MREHFVDMMAAEVSANLYGYRVEPGAVVLDCGANVGMFARYAIDRGAGRVVCFEPSPRTVEALRRNVPEAVIFERGVWDSETNLRFHTHGPNPGADLIAEDGELAITTTTIDAIVAALELERVDFIKMDIEGAELAALRGAWNTLLRFRPALAVATEHTAEILENNRRVLEYLKPLGYSVSCGECHVVGGKLTPYVLRFAFTE
jgi:FkbM family methyltransferase